MPTGDASLAPVSLAKFSTLHTLYICARANASPEVDALHAKTAHFVHFAAFAIRMTSHRSVPSGLLAYGI